MPEFPAIPRGQARFSSHCPFKLREKVEPTMAKKMKPARKSASRSPETKPARARSLKCKTTTAKTTKPAANMRVQLARKRSGKAAKSRTTSYELGKRVGECLSSLEDWGSECASHMRRLVRAGRSYLRSNSRKRSTGRISLRKSPKTT